MSWDDGRTYDSGPLAPLSLRGLLACAALFAACCHVLTCAPRAEEVPPTARIEEGPPEVWATDGEADASTISRPMPSKPFDGQKKAPCSKDEATILGACWLELARAPGEDLCGSKGFLHDGRCFVPVKRAERPPTSVMP